MSAPPILSELVEIKISSKLSQELSKRLFNQYKDSPNSLVDSVCPSTSPRSAAALTADMNKQRRMLCAMPRFLSNLPQERGSGMALHPGLACGHSKTAFLHCSAHYIVTESFVHFDCFSCTQQDNSNKSSLNRQNFL